MKITSSLCRRSRPHNFISFLPSPTDRLVSSSYLALFCGSFERCYQVWINAPPEKMISAAETRVLKRSKNWNVESRIRKAGAGKKRRDRVKIFEIPFASSTASSRWFCGELKTFEIFNKCACPNLISRNPLYFFEKSHPENILRARLLCKIALEIHNPFWVFFLLSLKFFWACRRRPPFLAPAPKSLIFRPNPLSTKCLKLSSLHVHV